MLALASCAQRYYHRRSISLRTSHNNSLIMGDMSPTSSPWHTPAVSLIHHTAKQAVVQSLQRGRALQVSLHPDSSTADEESSTLVREESRHAPPVGHKRWRYIIALTAIAIGICYADRSNISTAIIPMSDEYEWSTQSQGYVLSAFFAGYLCTQLIGGALSDAYGGKGILTVGVSIWSLTTCLTPFSASLGLPTLLAMRIAMGLGEGVAFPAIHAIIAKHIPPEMRSTSVAIVTASSYAGTAIAFAAAPYIIEGMGWPWVFYIFGASVVLWLPFWIPLAIPEPKKSTSLPEVLGFRTLWNKTASQDIIGKGSDEAPAVGDDEDALLADDANNRQPLPLKKPKRETGFRSLIKTKPVWAICAAQYCGSWGFYGLLTWLPSFFKDHYGVEVAQLAAFTFWPYAVQGGIGTVSGVFADALLSGGWPVIKVRRVLQTTGMVGPAICMIAAASPLTDGSPSLASAWVTAGLGLSALTLAGVSTNHLDIAPRHAGLIFATGNTAATFAGLIAVPITGLVLDLTHSWAVVFGITAAHYLIGAFLYFLWVGGQPLPEDAT